MLSMRFVFILLFFLLLFPLFSSAQMRQVYLDPDPDTKVLKLGFYSASQGFVAFQNWIGFTADSGHTFTKKPITVSNVDFGPYLPVVNLTFGFSIAGVKAFDANTLIAYGDYGFVPAILRSTNGGNSWTLVFHSQYDQLSLSGGIKDMVFPQNGNTGYAVDKDRVLKSTDTGLSWSVVREDPEAGFTVVDDNDGSSVVAVTYLSGGRVMKSINGGASWNQMVLPTLANGELKHVFFLNASNGWLEIANNTDAFLYRTTDGGNSWSIINDPDATPADYNFRFLNANLGYALAGEFAVYKTTDGGVSWEPLARDNNYITSPYGWHMDLQLLDANQLWAGGGHGFIEVSTNGGGVTLPKAYFKIDTAAGVVNLVNFSHTGYSYNWLLNGKVLSTSYSASYPHDVNRTKDTVTLIVSNGGYSDTLTKYQYYNLPVVITGFSPVAGASGTVVTITGRNFRSTSNVYFGERTAASFTVVSDSVITATVGGGATGEVMVVTTKGTAVKPGFIYYPPPANLNVTVSDSILCKSAVAIFAIANSETGVTYTLIDSLGTSWGFVDGNGATAAIKSRVISQSATYRIRASRSNVNSTFTFPRKFFIQVEHPQAIFTASRANIIAGETVSFTSRSAESSTYTWTLYEDASVPGSNLSSVPDVSYTSTGQKTLRLIATSPNGCADTTLSNAVYVFSKPGTPLTCFIQNTDDSDFSYVPSSPPIPNNLVSTIDNGFIISGHGNNPVLKSTIGANVKIPQPKIGYLAKYSEDGVLQWYLYAAYDGTIDAAAEDAAGNIYISGTCIADRWINLPNGDSLRAGALPGDHYIGTVTKRNGFILKLDRNGNYLWHTVVLDPSPQNSGYPAKGGITEHIKIKDNQIVLTGRFLANLAYYCNGQTKTIATLPNSTDPNSSQNNYILKIRPTGELVWSTYFTNNANNQERKIAGVGIDANSNLYVVGAYEQKVVIRDAVGTQVVYTDHNFQYNSYLLKLDSMGILQWKANWRNSQPVDIYTEPSGRTYITGGGDATTVHSADNSSDSIRDNGYQLFCFNPQGKFQWHTGTKDGNYGLGYSITRKNNLLYTTATFDVYSQSHSACALLSTDSNNVILQLDASEFFIASYDTNGVFKRVVRSGNTRGSLRPRDMMIDQHDNFIIHGINENWGDTSIDNIFGKTVPFNGQDCFFVKLNPDYCYPAIKPLADAGPDRVICSKDTIRIGTATISGNNYVWRSKPEGFYSLDASPMVGPVVATTYYLTVMNLQGLITTDSVHISMTPGPVTDLGADPTICRNSSIQIGKAGEPGNIYSWTSSAGGFVSTQPDPTVFPTDTTKYFLVLTNPSSACIFRDTIAVNVKKDVPPYVSLPSLGNVYCSNVPVTFTASYLNAGPTPSFQWVLNGETVGDSSATLTTLLSDSSRLKVIMTSSAFCANPLTVTSNEILLRLKASVPVSVRLASDKVNICPGELVRFTVSATNGGDTPNYAWKVNGILQAASTSTYSSSSLADNDAITVELTSSLACAGPVPAASNAITIHTGGGATAVSITGSTAVSNGGSSSVSVTVTGGGPSLAYQWQDSSSAHGWNDINGAHSSSLQYYPQSTGDGLRCSVTGSVCTATTVTISNVLTFSVSAALANGNAFIYPNPVHTVLTIDSLSLAEDWQEATITGINGSLDNSQVINIAGTTKVTIHVEHLEKGMYLLVLRRKDGTKKVMKFVRL